MKCGLKKAMCTIRSSGGKNFLVEIRSLNGKQYDIRLTLPSLLKPYEFDIRNILNEGLMRGSIVLRYDLRRFGKTVEQTANMALWLSFLGSRWRCNMQSYK